MEKIVENGENGEGLDIIHKFITDPNVEHEYHQESGHRKGSTDPIWSNCLANSPDQSQKFEAIVVSLTKGLNIPP